MDRGGRGAPRGAERRPENGMGPFLQLKVEEKGRKRQTSGFRSRSTWGQFPEFNASEAQKEKAPKTVLVCWREVQIRTSH